MAAGSHPLADRFAPSDGVAYLNAASQGRLPLAAGEAGRAALAMKERPWGITSETYVRVASDARGLLARLLGAREDQVALVTGAGAAVNAAARGLDLAPGDEVLLPAHEFPSNDFPWRFLAGKGVAVRVVEPDDATGAVSAGHLAAAIGSRTRVVAFAHVSYLHGGRIEPGPVVEAARKFGALVVVDGSQAAGAVPFDFEASGIDVYAVSGYKYLLSPYGTGAGLFSATALERLAVGDVNWWSVSGAEDFNHLPTTVRLLPGARRWDAHETASFNNLLPLAASIRLLLEATPAAVQAHARSLVDRLAASLPPRFAVASPTRPEQRSHILCIRGESPEATRRAHERLRAAKVVTALRGDRIRVSPHLYNGPEDVDRLTAALRGSSPLTAGKTDAAPRPAGGRWPLTPQGAPAIRACPSGRGNPAKTRDSRLPTGGGAVPGPGDREREDREPKGLSNLASGYQKAAPYMAASTSLVMAVGVFLGLGWWLDKKLENKVPWLTMLGALIGMTGGFISFFKTVLGKKDKRS